MENTKLGFGYQCQHTVSGIPTEFVYEKFSNKWFLAISQFKGLPNFFTVKFDQKLVDRLPPTALEGMHSVSILVNCNFGLDTDETRAAIQFLINQSKLKKCPEDLVISLGLKEINKQNLNEIVKILDEVVL